MESLLRELQDPITLELLEDPITVPCCTKAFSRSSLAAHLDAAGQDKTCPNCRRSLNDFDVANAARNVVLASMVDNIRGTPLESSSDGQHQWRCTVTPIAPGDMNEMMAELVLSCDKSRFHTRPSLFVAVMDESGSMTGRPMSQVRTALNHMVGLAQVNSQVELKMISYSSGAVEIDHASEYGKRVGGTNFRAAFQQICHLLRRYKCSDRPEDAHQLNNVSSVAIAFLTDGMDGSGVPRDQLVPEFRELLEQAGWLGLDQQENPPPLSVHAIGFGGSCDRDLLEAIRLAGNQEGLFRYADPQDDGDTLCNKLTDLFEFSSRASSVPVKLQIVEGEIHEIRFSVDSRRHGEHKQWILVKDPIYQVVVNSALDHDVVVPVEAKSPKSSVFQRWLSKCADELASKIVEVVRGDHAITEKVRRLYCSILEHQVNSISNKVESSNHELSNRVSFLRMQVEAVRAGNQVQLSKLSDLRFASLFASSKSNKQPRKVVDIRTLPPQEVPRLDTEPAFERPIRKRYSRNNQGTKRTPLQEAIVTTVADTVTGKVKDLIDQSTLEDLLTVDVDGNNALMLAAYCGHSAIITAILKNHPEIDLELKNPDGETAVTLAVKKRGFHHTLGVLLEAGACIPRRKAIQRFCIDNGYVITAQIIANYEQASLEVDETMTPEYVQFVYEHAIKSEEKTWDKAQFLNVALSKQLPRMARELLDAGVQPTIDMLVKHCIPPKPDHPETKTYLDLAKLLLEYRKELIFDRTEPEKETALYAAARLGSEPHVRYFIQVLQMQARNPGRFGAEIEAQNEKGNTPLWVASFMRYPCIMDILMDHGADVNHQNLKGNPPLYGACCRGPPKVAEQLIRRGAKVDSILKTGETNVLICCRNGTAEVLKLLLTYVDEDFVNRKAPIDGFNAIMAVAEQERVECIRVLYEYGINLDQCTEDDNKILARATPLHIAAYYGRAQAAQVLLELGANPDIQDIHGMTPLHLAVIQGSTALIGVLRSHADLQVKDNAGYTSVAYCRNNEEIQKLLVSPLVDPLMELAKGGYSLEEEAAAIEILKSCGIPGVVAPGDVLNSSDLGGTSLLSHAVMNMRRQLIEVMLELGVTMGQDLSCVHILTWAQWTRHRRIINSLETRVPGDAIAEMQIANINKEMENPVSADLLFPCHPPAYAPDPASTIAGRMALFVNAPFSTDRLHEQFMKDLPKLMPSEPHVDKYFDEGDLGEIQQTRLLWNSKLEAVRHIANGTLLDAAELIAISMYANNTVVAEVLNMQLLQRSFSSTRVKDYIGVLHRGMSKLLPYKGEVFLAASDIDRKLYMKGREFTWNRFVSASALWRVALESVPSFTAKSRRGVIFLMKSKTGRAVMHSSDAEVIFLPNTRFLVSNWYHGDVIALGQENIREHTFGIKERDDTRLNLREMTESDKSLIIELTELSP